MNYSYQRDREEFFGTIAKLGGTYGDARALLRAASTIQTIAERECSFEMSDSEAKRLERRSDAAVKRAESIAVRLNLSVDTSGDPRGYTLKLVNEGGREYGVPGRGLPTRCFA